MVFYSLLYPFNHFQSLWYNFNLHHLCIWSYLINHTLLDRLMVLFLVIYHLQHFTLNCSLSFLIILSQFHWIEIFIFYKSNNPSAIHSASFYHSLIHSFTIKMEKVSSFIDSFITSLIRSFVVILSLSQPSLLHVMPRKGS